MDDLTIRARTAMLDVLEALGLHRRSIIVIGAQAIHLQVSPMSVSLAPFTRDSDLAIDPEGLADFPRLEDILHRVGFAQNEQLEPGIWLRGPDGDMDDVQGWQSAL